VPWAGPCRPNPSAPSVGPCRPSPLVAAAPWRREGAAHPRAVPSACWPGGPSSAVDALKWAGRASALRPEPQEATRGGACPDAAEEASLRRRLRAYRGDGCRCSDLGEAVGPKADRLVPHWGRARYSTGHLRNQPRLATETLRSHPIWGGFARNPPKPGEARGSPRSGSRHEKGRSTHGVERPLVFIGAKGFEPSTSTSRT
jgi:hypothetical protein